MYRGANRKQRNAVREKRPLSSNTLPTPALPGSGLRERGQSQPRISAGVLSSTPVFSFLRPVKIIEKNGDFVNTIAGSQYRLSRMEKCVFRLLTQVIRKRQKSGSRRCRKPFLVWKSIWIRCHLVWHAILDMVLLQSHVLRK